MTLCSAQSQPRRWAALLDVVAEFCHWPGMLVKLEKLLQQRLASYGGRSTEGILYHDQEIVLVHLQASERFPYLEVRTSILASTVQF
jgi:hypothetical protein